jgi:hypothetical protein
MTDMEIHGSPSEQAAENGTIIKNCFDKEGKSEYGLYIHDPQIA